MDLEASVAERLEKLRQWQIEQQEKLLEQQRIQREILSQEQDRIYKVLRLSLDSDFKHIVEDTENGCSSREIMMNTTEQAICDNAMLQCNVKNSNNMLKMDKEKILGRDNDELHEYRNEKEKENPISVVIDKNTNLQKNCNSSVLSQNVKLSSDMLVEGVKPLPLDNITSNKSTVSIDDIPVLSSKKNFQTLLEERLEKELKVASKVCTNSKNQKRPFLKKGQGLSRFKGLSLNPVVKKMNVASLSHNTQCIDKIDTNNKLITRENIKNIDSNASVINTPIAVKTPQKLSLKAASLPRKIICSKSVSITPTKSTGAVNTISNRLKCLSDFDSKTENELEEVRMFELLEEKAENSSFCSTSSTVIAFLQQSTPFKMKKSLNCIGNDTLTNTKQHKGMSDALERHCIVEQFTNSENSRQTTQYPSNQFNTNKVSHNNVADVNWDTAIVNDTIVEDIQEYFTVSNKIPQNKEVCMDHSEDDEIHNVTSSDTDVVEEDMHENHRSLVCDSEVNVNHRVRFSEHNEYRIIDLTNMVNASSNKSALINHHLEQEDWDDCSASESRSYGIDRLSLDCNEAQICCSPQAISNEKVPNASMQLLSPQHNIMKDYHIIRSGVTIPDEKNKNEYGQSLFDNENSNKCSMSTTIEEISQIDKNSSQQSVLLNHPFLIDAHQVCSKVYEKEEEEEEEEETEEEAEIKEEEKEEEEEEEGEEGEEEEEKEEEYTQRNRTEKMTEMNKNVEKFQRYVSSEDKEDWKMSNFESDVLKTRLLELEKEIDIFRKESSALLFQRQKLQEDQTLLHKKYIEKERSFEENKIRIQNQLQEEQKRLMREKIAMENRIRDAQEKARQNKLEKQKMQDLQEQLEKLRDELNRKESRWSAAESRYKSELRALRVEMSKLKQEIANSHDFKKTTNIRNTKRINGQINTKTVNQIKTSPNKRIIATLSKKTCTKVPSNMSDMCVHDKYDNEDHDDINDKNDIKDRLIEPTVNVIDMDDDLEEMEDNLAMDKSEQVAIKLHPKRDQRYTEENIAIKKRDLYENLLKDATSDFIQDQQCSSAIIQNISSRYNDAIIMHMRDSKTKSNAQNNDNPNPTNKNLENTNEVFAADCSKYYIDRLCKTDYNDRSENVPMLITSQDREFPHEKTNSMSHISCQNDRENTKNAVKEIKHSDGRMEYLYPNGNVKKVFPDQGLTKMIYYNGDVRETHKDGKVKYFYATTRTWHTTTLDGLEILEFPDGQVEKHSSDGTIEVSFPDGVLRIAQADDTEKWVLPDGTVAQTFVNGDKILTLPNGQREIHTKEHKRREYPDGTVKLVYADGTQETRYSSGRKRLKDKDGNLIMDFYDN